MSFDIRESIAERVKRAALAASASTLPSARAVAAALAVDAAANHPAFADFAICDVELATANIILNATRAAMLAAAFAPTIKGEQ